METWIVVLFGDSDAGLSSLAVQFTLNAFVLQYYDPTIEDSYRKCLVVDSKPCMVEVIDTAGCEEYTSLRETWIKEGHAYILAYSITSRASFEHLEFYRQAIFKVFEARTTQPVITIVGNQCDRIIDREVSFEEGLRKARSFGCQFFETSAKTSRNVEESFVSIVRVLRSTQVEIAPPRVVGKDAHFYKKIGRFLRPSRSNSSNSIAENQSSGSSPSFSSNAATVAGDIDSVDHPAQLSTKPPASDASQAQSLIPISAAPLPRICVRPPELEKPILNGIIDRAFALKEDLHLPVHTADLIVLIDTLDLTVNSSDPDSEGVGIRLRALANICGRTGILPSSHMLNSGLVKLGSNPIAGGAFGEVWQGAYEGQSVAIKALKFYSTDNPETLRKNFCKEVVLWKRLSHVNIVPFLGVSTELFPLCMVSDWMPGGNVRRFVQSKPDVDRLGLLIDIASGLSYLHSQHIVHGDLKGDNILVNDSNRACLCDFGLASLVLASGTSASTRRGCGSIRWMAPELFDVGDEANEPPRPNSSSDIYALSMIVIEIFTGRLPFPQYRDESVMLKTLQNTRPDRPEGSLELGLSDEMWGMVRLGWAVEPHTRPNVKVYLELLLSVEDRQKLGSEIIQGWAL